MSPGSRWNFEVLLGRCSWIESGPHHRDLRKVGNWQTCGWLHRWLGGSRFFEFWILFSNRREMWMETPKEVVHSLPLGRWVPDSARCDSAKIACRYLKTALHLGDRRHTEKAIDVGPSTLFRTNIWFGKTHWNCLKSMMFFLMFFCFPLAHCSESIFEKDRWKRMPWWRLFFFFSGEYLTQFYPQNEMSTTQCGDHHWSLQGFSSQVLVLSLVFMAIVCSLHILGKFRSGWGELLEGTP